MPRTLQVVFLAVAMQALVSLAQQCGPSANNKVCTDGNCCSSAGWCGKTSAHCNPQTCQKEFSAPSSPCSTGSNSRLFPMQVPNIDECGPSVGISCPGAGANGYFYRCCSSSGHCGPKNDIQDQALYCGQGCQSAFGQCGTGMAKPPRPTATPRIVGAGENCGPIVNARCADGLCCSGSNFCGTGPDFCGSANWCQPNYGLCF